MFPCWTTATWQRFHWSLFFREDQEKTTTNNIWSWSWLNFHNEPRPCVNIRTCSNNLVLPHPLLFIGSYWQTEILFKTVKTLVSSCSSSPSVCFLSQNSAPVHAVCLQVIQRNMMWEPKHTLWYQQNLAVSRLEFCEATFAPLYTTCRSSIWIKHF